MLRHDDLAFIKAISTFELSSALLKELRLALTPRRKEKPVVSRLSTMPGVGQKPPIGHPFNSPASAKPRSGQLG